jgi:N-acetylneuraminate epimerase
VLSYSPAANTWQSLGTLPFLPTVGAAIAFDGEQVTLINGELKPGLRSYSVNRVETVGDSLRSQAVPDLVAPEGELQQEGLAGAFAGYSRGVLLAAGGANFPGAWNQYRQGQHHAHRGLKKIWRDEVYALVDGEWCVPGRLPEGRAYGVSVQLDKGLLMVGGETDGGRAVEGVCLLRWGQRG